MVNTVCLCFQTNLERALVAEYFFVADPRNGNESLKCDFYYLQPAAVVSLPKVVTRGSSEYTAEQQLKRFKLILKWTNSITEHDATRK